MENKEGYRLKEKISDYRNNLVINNEKMFRHPFLFNGRIGRMEYLLSFISCCAFYYLSLLLIPLFWGYLFVSIYGFG